MAACRFETRKGRRVSGHNRAEHCKRRRCDNRRDFPAGRHVSLSEPHASREAEIWHTPLAMRRGGAIALPTHANASAPGARGFPSKTSDHLAAHDSGPSEPNAPVPRVRGNYRREFPGSADLARPDPAAVEFSMLVEREIIPAQFPRAM